MKKILSFLVVLWYLGASSQIISSNRWTDLFSYNNVIAIREDGNRLIAATENGLFFYTPNSGEITKLSKANGLHEVKISAFDYDPATKTGLIGYQNGSLDFITPDGITLVVDIPIATGYNGDKKINHISINGNLAAISVGYGVSVFRMDKKEFGDTSFFTSGGTFEASREAVIKDNKVYAATASGLKSHVMDFTFPIYSSWTTEVPGNITQLALGSALAYATASQVFYSNGGGFTALAQSFNNVRDVVISSQNITVADAQSVYVYSSSGSFVKSYSAGEQLNTGNFIGSEIYAGTQTSGMKNTSGTVLKPDGPFSNTSYKIDLQGGHIAISSGGRQNFNSPIIKNLGYYHFNGVKWIYPDLFKNPTVSFNVLDAVINPSKLSEIFFVNYTFEEGGKGVYRMDNDQFSKKYITDNQYFNRVFGGVFDENNQFFVSEWGALNNENKIGFYYYDRAADKFNLVSTGQAKLAQKPIAKDGVLYIGSPAADDGGLLIYDYNNTPSSTGDDRYKILRKANNIPKSTVVAVTVDKSDNVWIGSQEGLRILSNPKAALTDENPQAEAIIIEENGLGEELFRDSNVLQIEVDGGNQKWVSIEGGGVFYLSATGEQTLRHFTKENSPLPNNSVTDIKVDNKSGKVYFVTLDGVMVYQGDVLDVTENFGDVLVYPNPVVYSQYKGNVSIRGLAQKTNIRITDAAGNLVHQAVSRGGYYEWNLNNHRGVRVASGIYFVLMTNADGTDKATAKIAVVN